MKLTHMNMIVKIYKESNKYDWKEFENTNRHHEKSVFPENIENEINTYYTILEEKLFIVVGNFTYKFYYDEDKFREQRQEYISINVLNNSSISGIKNIEIITSSDLQRFMRQNEVDLLVDDIEIKNYIELIYRDVNEQVNDFDDIYNNFMSDDFDEIYNGFIDDDEN